MDYNKIYENVNGDIDKLNEAFRNKEISFDEYKAVRDMIINAKIENLDPSKLAIPQDILNTLNKKQLKQVKKKGLLNPGTQGAANQTAKSGNGKKIGIIAAIVVAVVAVILIIIGIFSLFGSTKVDVDEYIDAEVVGFDGAGTVVLVDTKGEPISSEEGELGDYIYKKAKADLNDDEKKAFRSFKDTFEYEAEPSSEISNGDSVKVTISYDEDAASEAGIEFTNTTIEVKAEDLEDGAELITETEEDYNTEYTKDEYRVSQGILGTSVVPYEDYDGETYYAVTTVGYGQYFDEFEFNSYTNIYSQDLEIQDEYSGYSSTNDFYFYSGEGNDYEGYDYATLVDSVPDVFSPFEDKVSDVNPEDGISQDNLDILQGEALALAKDDAFLSDATPTLKTTFVTPQGALVFAYIVKDGSDETYHFVSYDVIAEIDGELYYSREPDIGYDSNISDSSNTFDDALDSQFPDRADVVIS